MLSRRGCCGGRVGRVIGGINTKLYDVGDGAGRPLTLYLTTVQTSDCRGAEAILLDLPVAKVQTSSRGYDSNRIKKLLQISILSSSSLRGKPVKRTSLIVS